MKIGLIADIHHGPHSHAKKAGWDELAALDVAVARLNTLGAEILIDLGDRISDRDRDTDLTSMAEVQASLSRFAGLRYHLMGNHDVGILDVADNARILGQSMEHQVVDLGEVRLILWQPDATIDMSVVPLNFSPAAPSLPWLVAALEADDRPAIIASHAPLSGQSQIGNFYFENNAAAASYPDHAEVRAAVEATGKAAIWLSGHVHWNTVTNVRNIQYITIQSLTERFTTYPEPAAAFAMLEIADGVFTLEVFGADPFFARLPFRPSGEQTWLKPLAPFSASAGQIELQQQVNAQMTGAA